MKFAVLLSGHVRDSLKHDNVKKIIKAIEKKGECDVYCWTFYNKDHSTKTWYQQDRQLQNEKINLYDLKNFLNFKKIKISKEKKYTKQEINNLWGKSPVSFVGVKSMYNGIFECLNLLEQKYDYVFRMRFDYHKFNYANYTRDILDLLSKIDFFDNSVNSVKVKNSRGEDCFFYSSQKNFTKILEYIIINFDKIESEIKKLNYYFMPEDLLLYSCKKQNIIYKVHN
jgi:hypothetical protein